MVLQILDVYRSQLYEINPFDFMDLLCYGMVPYSSAFSRILSIPIVFLMVNKFLQVGVHYRFLDVHTKKDEIRHSFIDDKNKQAAPHLRSNHDQPHLA